MADLPLVDAAARLQLSPTALRKRLQRGHSIQGWKVDGEWWVRLPDAAASPRPAHGSPAGRPSPENGQATGSPPTSHWLPVADSSLAETLQQEVRFLRDELRRRDDQLEHQVADFQQRLAAREQAEAELRRLLALALQTRALPEPREPAPETAAPGVVSPPWWERWRWWRR